MLQRAAKIQGSVTPPIELIPFTTCSPSSRPRAMNVPARQGEQVFLIRIGDCRERLPEQWSLSEAPWPPKYESSITSLRQIRGSVKAPGT